MEHLRENFLVLLLFWPFCGTFAGVFLRKMLLFWPFCGTFAGEFPGFVAVLAVFLEHLRENLRRLRDDLPERCDLAREGNSERKLA